MAKKKEKMTEAQMKDKLWDIFKETDWDGDDFWSHPEFDKLLNQWLKDSPDVLVPAFKVKTAELGKIRANVEDSCLVDSTKKSILAALKATK